MCALPLHTESLEATMTAATDGNLRLEAIKIETMVSAQEYYNMCDPCTATWYEDYNDGIGDMEYKKNWVEDVRADRESGISGKKGSTKPASEVPGYVSGASDHPTNRLLVLDQ